MTTPNLDQVIVAAMESRLTGLHTMLPGKVVKVDVAAGKCDVQPLIQRLGTEGTPVTLPVITNCPISFYRAGKAALYLPLHVGDYVEIKFCERSLDVWLAKGGTVDPLDARKHQLSDAVVYPGLYPFTDPPTKADPSKVILVNDVAKMSLSADGAMKLENGSGSITLTAGGKFLFTGASGELLAYLITHLENLIAAQTIDPLTGPEPFFPADVTKFTTDKANITGLKA